MVLTLQFNRGHFNLYTHGTYTPILEIYLVIIIQLSIKSTIIQLSIIQHGDTPTPNSRN